MELNKQLTMEEEAIKRNTDCVYFLASPLTCKKGSECEYRHSETARINPRDCWFWMNGNCLNPKCAFRHPPLDGLVGPPVGVTSAGPSLPPQPAALIQTSAPQAPTNSSSKQTVPCFYFQKGLCLKGDKCPFMHGSQAVNNPAPQQTVRVGPVTDPLQTPKKPPNEPLKPTFQQKSPPKFFVKSVEEIAPPAKPIFKPEISPDDTINVTKNTIPVLINDEFITRSKPNDAPVFTGIPAVNRPRTRQTQPLEDGFPDGEESDEFLGESSPGFDVLVDDELEDSNYFLSEDIEYRRSADHGRRDLSNSIGEFDYGRHSPVIVDSLAKFDRDPHLDLGDYEFYGRVNDRFGWEQRRASSERILERSSMPERRGLLREESPNQIGGSDLRHRLSKRKRVNGSRFDDHRGEFYRRDKGRLLEEDRYKGRSRRDPVHFSTESSMSKRLQGRITLSSRSSGDKTSFDSNSNREIERGRNWGGRLSPARPSPYLGRLHERITRRTPDEISTATEGRNFRCQQLSSRDDVNFAGPKSLAELKNAKSSATLRSEVVHDKHKGSGVGKVPGHQESENTHSFEGPKPLSVILKRKRETGFGNGTDLSNIEVKQTEREDPATEVAELQPTTNAQQPVDFRKAAHHSPSSNEELKGIENMVRLANEGIDSMDSVRDSQSPIRGDLAHLEEDLMMEEGTEDQEIEGSDQRDGESEEGNWKMEEVNGDPEDEFLDDEDGDDFARRLGVMFS